MYKYKNESIYIAGPECFYENGYDLWSAMGKSAEHYGFNVVMPTKNALKLDNEDLRKNADEIFQNCAKAMNEATAIIADLEFFRGFEPDGGTLFEIGMAHARGIRCYGFTRDKRDMVFKYKNAVLKDCIVYDEEGRILPYKDLPFCPSLIGSCKIIEGNFNEALKLLMIDVDETRKGKEKLKENEKIHKENSSKPVAYLASPIRFDLKAKEKYDKMKQICESYGIKAITPLDDNEETENIKSEDPYAIAYNTFKRCEHHIRNCDILIADLSDFHGFEPNSDTAFECGMAWQLGKKCFGYMPNTLNMIDRIPNYKNGEIFQDLCGHVVEDFNYPINLMFASSMPIFEGDFEKVMDEISKRIN